MESSPKKQHDRNFKLGAVKLVVEEGQKPKAVAQELGVEVATLYGWIQRYKAAGNRPLPGSGRHKPDDEISKLKEEIRILKMEREILKKTLPLFMEAMK